MFLYGCRACARRRVASSLGVTSGRRMMQALRRDRGMCIRSAAATLASWTSCVGGVHSCSTRSACRKGRRAEITREVEWQSRMGVQSRRGVQSRMGLQSRREIAAPRFLDHPTGHLRSGRVRLAFSVFCVSALWSFALPSSLPPAWSCSVPRGAGAPRAGLSAYRAAAGFVGRTHRCT
jgi:hypothetical protein